MTCIGPTTPDDLELLAYADNQASADVVEHLSTCPTCQARANVLGREQHMLQVLLYRTGCPRSLELGEYGMGLLTGERATEIAAHLSCCPTCRSELATLDVFMVGHARSGAYGGAEQVIGMLRTVVARLSDITLGGSAGRLAPALRGVSPDAVRAPAVYDAEEILVTVESWPEGLGRATRQLVGLVAGFTNSTGASVEIEGGDSTSSIAAIDDLGNFGLPGIPPAKYNLLIRLPADGMEIRIDDLDVG